MKRAGGYRAPFLAVSKGALVWLSLYDIGIRAFSLSDVFVKLYIMAVCAKLVDLSSFSFLSTVGLTSAAGPLPSGCCPSYGQEAQAAGLM